ncbi:MAG: ABC transporter ATP-binding protein [Candidatus Riflebacteria bacterium]|nr:ABC transporter ATP-binding protein [Candidatus Riflebacteria bacterium]
MIELNNLTKYYDNFRALDNINLKVDKGEILGLLGPNGAGKTTAMRILSCFIPATSGTAKVAGFDVFEDSIEVRRRLGYLPETPPLYLDMTVGSYLDFVGKIREISYKDRKKSIDSVTERLGLQDYRDRIISTLSKGYRQRVGLAQAMIHNPEVLILDEPTVGLDPNQIIEIRELIKSLAQQHTVILSTHILSEVSASCNRVVIINEGQIVAEDSVDNLENRTIGKPGWHISLKAPKELDWKDSIKKIDGAEIADEQESNGINNFNLKLSSKDDFDAFFSGLASKGAIFKEITPIKATLEDVFMKLTSNEEGKEDK